jgi:hypothetical protein
VAVGREEKGRKEGRTMKEGRKEDADRKVERRKKGWTEGWKTQIGRLKEGKMEG